MGESGEPHPLVTTLIGEERRQTPPGINAGVDLRVVDAWCAWLDALATDAEAALSASMAYKDLDPPARETWLRALEQDAERVGVPRVAMYAPLLAVETDPGRRQRIFVAMGKLDSSAAPRSPAIGLRGIAPGGLVIAAVVSPLYLDFVQVLACGFFPHSGFEWVRHDPIVERECALRDRSVVEGVVLEVRPLSGIIDELASSILAHRRAGKQLPDALRAFAHIFSPGLPDSSPASP
ncbi:MAG: hypothetical protein JW751_10180 [Polyangiaceae bacterium]|nr:hypothetical protein [Polyangiaceae bacterium]